jgi:radical SAM superfamily enzyme YgiQ (UPF0313 family)
MANTLFHRPDIIRPPNEWRSYYLPLTDGCSNHKCAFCNYYGRKLQIRDIDDVKREIDAIALFMQQHLVTLGIPEIAYAVAYQWNGRRIFLQDGDALVYPAEKLKEVLQYIKQKLPTVERVSTYATARDVLSKGLETMKELQTLKLGRLYMGIESGDDEVLKKVDKNVTSAQILEAGKIVKEAGILNSVSVILGLAGITGGERHIRETAKLLTAMDPDHVGALTLTFVPSTPLYQEWEQGKFTLISPLQSLEELASLVEQCDFTKCHFSSAHASNYFAIEGELPEDKEKILTQLRDIIKQGDPALLRPEFLRGL